MSGRAKRHLGFRIEDAAADARGTKRLVGAVAQLRPTIGNLWVPDAGSRKRKIIDGVEG